MSKVKGLGKYKLSKVEYNFNQDGASDKFRVKGYWKQYYKKQDRRKRKNTLSSV